ncbi:MAG: AraC family transcriptional regulator [Actinomycetota bacterium]
MAKRSNEHCSSFAPDVAGVDEVLHATFTEHRYPVHCHDTWTVLIVDDGAVTYELDGRRRTTERRTVTVLPPHVAHDGRSARIGRAFRKRVLYLDAGLVGEELTGRAVDRSDIVDAALHRAVDSLHRTFARPADDLEQDSLVDLIATSIPRALGVTVAGSGQRSESPAASSSDAAEALKAALDRQPFARHRLADVAVDLGWNETHLIRSFSETFGLAPHRYLISRRIDEARRRLLDGVAPSTVAVDVGFWDQAHLTRHFRAHVGTTPARFQRAGCRHRTIN